MLNSRFIYILIILLVLLTACVPTRELERLGIINTYGIDISNSQDGQIESTLIVFQFDAQAENVTKTLSGLGYTVKGARENANTKSSYILSPGQVRLMLYGKEAAEEGIFNYVSPLVRDARVPATMLLAVTNTTAKEVLTLGQENTSINVGQYLHDLIEQEYSEDLIPRVTLHDFTHKLAAVGEDPILPVINLVEDIPQLTSIGIFKDDKYVEEISIPDALWLNLFHKRVQSAPLELRLTREPFKEYIQSQNGPQSDKEDIHIVIDISGSSHTKITHTDELRYKTDINLEIDLREFSEELMIEDEQVADVLEKEVERAIKANYETLLEKLQEINSDPFGFGQIYRAKNRNSPLTQDKWREKFPDISVEFNVNVKLKNYGTVK
ncbi:Ger(x)C family spore germination protein [Virgibacillus sp. C22-A2]|uniref:Ger(X)C family spore germination protein n=1 Tax=Virgibacillus tibetensis TaxID=3042313 RepID=A0ABU6KEI7_9BACI|nr:Ger(x)C family spore germination protein [Virgibacillus sp. C22-A2]